MRNETSLSDIPINIFLLEEESKIECIICLNTQSNNILIENKVCSCKYHFHKECMEIYFKESIAPYKCLLCKKEIHINILGEDNNQASNQASNQNYSENVSETGNELINRCNKMYYSVSCVSVIIVLILLFIYC